MSLTMNTDVIRRGLVGSFDIAKFAGVDEFLLDRYANHIGDAQFDVDPAIRNQEISEDQIKGTVLLPLTQGKDATLSYSYAILAHAFRERGLRPILPLCDQDLDLCHLKERKPDDSLTCGRCFHYGQRLLDAFGFPTLRLEDTLPSDYSAPTIPIDEEELGSTTYRGIPVGGLAAASARRFLKKRLLDLKDAPDHKVVQRFLDSAAKLTDVAYRLHEEYDIEATVTHHPTYIYGGVFLEVTHKLGIPAYSVQPGYNNQTLLFGRKANRSALPQFSPDELLEDVIQSPLSETERDRIQEFMDARTEGKDVRMLAAREAEREINLDHSGNTLGLFTNLMWDASLEAGDPLFSNAYSWVVTTIEAVRDLDDTVLVIKPHPAEKLRETKEGMASWLRSNFDPLPENVVLLEPDTDVSPYHLIEEIDLGIVYNSTIGLEMACRGLPVVVAGETHYRGLGFTHDPQTFEEYAQSIRRTEHAGLSNKKRGRALRYAHYLLLEKQIPFPFYNQEDLDIELLPVEEDTLRSMEHVFDLIVDRVERGEPIYIGRGSSVGKSVDTVLHSSR